MTDVDDDHLGALFRAAASDSGAPPPGFDHSAVVVASRRVTARRRAALTGAGLALLVVAGVGTAVTVPFGDGGGAGDASTVAAPMLAPESPTRGDSRARDEGAPEAAAAPAPDAAVGGSPLGPGTGECADRQDPALRALVEQVLPEVVGAPEAATTEECRPGGERGMNVEISDGAATGLLSVQYLPPGTAVQLVEGALSAPTASGGTVVVSSRTDRTGAPAPLAGRLAETVAYLAPRL